MPGGVAKDKKVFKHFLNVYLFNKHLINLINVYLFI